MGTDLQNGLHKPDFRLQNLDKGPVLNYNP